MSDKMRQMQNKHKLSVAMNNKIAKVEVQFEKEAEDKKKKEEEEKMYDQFMFGGK